MTTKILQYMNIYSTEIEVQLFSLRILPLLCMWEFAWVCYTLYSICLFSFLSYLTCCLLKFLVEIGVIKHIHQRRHLSMYSISSHHSLFLYLVFINQIITLGPFHFTFSNNQYSTKKYSLHSLYIDACYSREEFSSTLITL